MFPADLVEVLTSREIAAQERATFAQQRDAQEARVSLEQQRGVADMQAQLAQANVSVDIEKSKAEAATRPGRGRGRGHHDDRRAPRRPAPRRSARPTAAAEEALGLARAKGFDAQRRAIGAEQTALVAALREVGTGHVKIVPDIQVGGDEGGVIGGLGALLMRNLATEPAHRNGDGDGLEPVTTPPTPLRRDRTPADRSARRDRAAEPWPQ